jgi:1,4-dihydroxy-2-naphthoate octaprenyltransferase
MQVRIPFLKISVPELESLPMSRQEEILAHPSMSQLAKRHMMLMRLGWAFLPIGLVAFLVLSHTDIDPRIISYIFLGSMAASVTWMVGAVILYHFRSSRQLHSLALSTFPKEK